MRSPARILIAVRLNASEVNTRIAESRLRIEPPTNRPILRARRIPRATDDRGVSRWQNEREVQLDGAVKVIDFTALDHGDQGAFDESLRDGKWKLEPLRAVPETIHHFEPQETPTLTWLGSGPGRKPWKSCQ